MKILKRVLIPIIGTIVLVASCTGTSLYAATTIPTDFVPLTSTQTYTPSPSAQPTIVPFTPTSTSAAVNATTFPNPDQYTWSPVVSGLTRPVGLVSAGDSTGMLYVIEQAGVIRVINNGQLLPNPFLDIRDRVGSQGNEQGLLGLAFHPKYKENEYFYVNYTDLNGNTVISRFTASTNATPVSPAADPASEFVLLRVNQPYANHNGGQLAFGPDGMLWIGLGDGGSEGDPLGNGQSVQTLLSKLLRIDVDHGNPYAIPPDNPFAQGGGLPEIWAFGLRNPWRFSFDLLTGDLYIGDVGQDLWEEIDYLPSGSSALPANFGWSIREGLHPYKGGNATGLIDPIFEYGHDLGCAVTGGYVYRGKALPAFYGIYLFGDYCSGRIWGLIQNGGKVQTQILFDSGLNISSFGVDDNGEIYVLDLNGSIYSLQGK